MRKPEREITDPAELQYVLDKALVCRIGMVDDGEPYVVPMNFGLGDSCLYLHSSAKGRKAEVMRKSPLVCFEMEADVAMVEADLPCDWTVRYRSIIGTGTAVFLEDRDEKLKALTAVMAHYSEDYAGDEPAAFREKVVDMVAVIRIDIQSMTGKKHGWNA